MAEDIVFSLKTKPFSLLTNAQKIALVKKGRPCPSIKNLNLTVKDKDKTYVRHFSVTNYEHYSWMCGSDTLSKVFCWPCILFATQKTTWSNEGFSNLSGLTSSAKKHESSQNHLQCVLSLHSFGMTRIQEGIDKSINNELHNSKVRRNREILKRLIDVTCFLAQQELPFHGHNESRDSLNRGNYVELLKLISLYDPVLAEHMETSTVFKGTSNDIQNDIIDAIAKVTLLQIQQEIDDSNYVALMLDETSDINKKSQLSTVIRYVSKDKCEIKERFVGYTDVCTDRTAEGLFQHVKEVVSIFKIGEKLVAQTYDGAAVMSGQQSGLQKRVLEEFPMAHFTHCYAHILNLVLAQGMNDIPECKVFFSTLQGISTFSSHSSKRSYAVQEFLKASIPSFAPTQWCFTSRLVNTVNTYYNEIKSMFQSIHMNLEGDWKGQDRCVAEGYELFMEKFDTVFLINFFSPVFEKSDLLFKVLQTENIDISTCLSMVREFLSYLEHLRNGSIELCNVCKSNTPTTNCTSCKIQGFDELWQKVTVLRSPPPPGQERRKGNQDDLSFIQKYRRLYYNILDNIMNHMRARFSSLENMRFFEVFNNNKYPFFASDEGKLVLQMIITDLGHLYPKIFNLINLKSELTVIQSSETFKTVAPKNILNYIKTQNLHHAFKESFKLAALISTIPATTSSLERSFSALKRIHAYKRSTQAENRLSNLALISIEKDLLLELRGKSDFHDKVTTILTLKIAGWNSFSSKMIPGTSDTANDEYNSTADYSYTGAYDGSQYASSVLQDSTNSVDESYEHAYDTPTSYSEACAPPPVKRKRPTPAPASSPTSARPHSNSDENLADNYQAFSELVVAQLKSLPASRAAILQMKIQELLSKVIAGSEDDGEESEDEAPSEDKHGMTFESTIKTDCETDAAADKSPPPSCSGDFAHRAETESTQVETTTTTTMVTTIAKKKSLRQDCAADNKENQQVVLESVYTAFSKCIVSQLKYLPAPLAVKTQNRIQKVISDEIVKFCNSRTDGDTDHQESPHNSAAIQIKEEPEDSMET